ncbi:MAG: hypothetical protein ACI9WU_004749 [Myxococcota bacterium]|jgi:hypothetical protein
MSSEPGDEKTPKKSKRRGRPFHKTRWLYRHDGRDLGPFSPEEVKDLLRQSEIDLDTPVRESAHKEFHPVREVRAFGEFFKEIQGERKQQAKERELDHQEKQVRSGRRAPRMALMLLLIGILGAGGWYGWTLYQSRQVKSISGYGDSLFASLELTQVEQRAWMKTSNKVEWVDEKVKVREVKDKATKRASRSGTRKSSGGSAPAAYTDSHKDLGGCGGGGGVRDLSFGDGETGRALSASDVNRVNGKATPGLVRCAQKEANRAPNFPGTTVCFTVQPSGKLGKVKFGSNGRRSSAFTGCVRSTLGKIRVPAFDANATSIGRTIRVPLRVGR